MLKFLDTISIGTPRLRRATFWLLCGFIAYVSIGFLIFPPVLRRVLISQCSAALNRPTTIDRVAFNPLTLHLEVDGLTVQKLDGEGPFISLGELEIAPGVSSIWELAPVVSYLRLSDFMLDITFFGDGKYSISDLIGSPLDDTDKKDTATDNAAIFPFALYGFEMSNATIVFDDKPHMKKHIISDMNVVVPFTSSFERLRKEFTQPRFTATINGDPVELTGRTLPFDSTLRTEFELGAVNVDLKQYWTYLPIDSSLKLVKGNFTSDLALTFERPTAQRITLFLGGGGTLADLELAAPKDGTVFSLKNLNFQMEKFSLADNQLTLSSIVMDQPYFKVIRGADDVINWEQYLPGSKVTPQGAKVKTPDEASAFNLTIKSTEVKSGILDWHDKAVPGEFKRTYPNFTFKSSKITTEGDQPSTFEAAIGKEGIVTAKGTATLEPFSAQMIVNARGFNLSTYKPYIDQVQPLTVDSGMVDASVGIDFLMKDDTPQFSLHDGALTLTDFKARKPDAKEPSLGITKLAISGTAVDPATQTVTVDMVGLTGPTVTLAREKTGELDLVDMFVEKDSENKTPETMNQNATAPWTATVRAVQMSKGAFTVIDHTMEHPTLLTFNGLTLDAKNVTTRKGESITYATSGLWGKRGSLTIDGTATLEPLTANGRLTLKDMSLRPLGGHLGEFSELLFASGAISANLEYAFTDDETPIISLKGKADLAHLKLKDKFNNGEFAGLDALKLTDIALVNEPFSLSIANIHLDGPSVSVNFDKKGRLNLRRAFRIAEPEPVPSAENGQQKPQKPVASEKARKAAPEPAPTQDSSVPDIIKIGTVTMANGHVLFHDASVHPPYTTDISNIKLELSDIARTPEARPKMSLSADVGPTPMTVKGTLNPATTPIFADLAISVSGMELVPLSPYTVHYMAYPIERGRLYADVSFKTENWNVQANNKFFIEQLLLGPKDKRPGAPNVPVKFGISLLQDSSGNMELDLPIRGRLDDPNFRISGIVFKTIASLFVKALASPFSLIGSIFGGGSENMDFVAFDPGLHTLSDRGKQKLDTTVKALKERPRLKLEVNGVVDPATDGPGLINAIFETQLKKQKFDSLPRKERATTSIAEMVIAPDEYEELLFEAYKDAPDEEDRRPEGLFSTDIQPVDVMKQFIIDGIKVTDDDLHVLGIQRATTVKEYIIGEDPELTKRVYLIDRKTKTNRAGIPKQRVDLGIK